SLRRVQRLLDAPCVGALGEPDDVQPDDTRRSLVGRMLDAQPGEDSLYFAQARRGDEDEGTAVAAVFDDDAAGRERTFHRIHLWVGNRVSVSTRADRPQQPSPPARGRP